MYNESVTGALAVLFAILVLSFMIWLQPTRPAYGHEHNGMKYDPVCCSNKDGSPAKVRFIGNGRIEATTRFGVAVFDMKTIARDRIKTSTDGQDHACIPPWATTMKEQARCIYVPAGI